MLSFLGVPPLRGHGRLVAAFVVDAVGTGLFLPLSVLYFLATTDLTLAQVGLALSLGSIVRVLASPPAGQLVDRLGPLWVLRASNVVQGLGFVGYLWAGSLLTVVLATGVVQLGNVAFWTAYGPLVIRVSEPGQRERWFGFLGALRNVGFAVGGILAGVAAAVGGTGSYHAVVVVNVVSFTGAFLLLLGVHLPRRVVLRASSAPERGAWRVVLRDRPYLALVAVNLWIAMITMALQLALPVYVLDDLGLPGWLPGAAFTLNTVLIGLGQGQVVTWITGHRRAAVLQLSAVLSAAGCVVLLVAGAFAAAAAVAVVLVGVLLLTAGELAETPVIAALSNEAAPEELRGRYLATFQQSWNVASIVGPALLTGLLSAGPAPAWLGLAAVCLLGGLGMRALAPHQEQARVRVGLDEPT